MILTINMGLPRTWMLLTILSHSPTGRLDGMILLPIDLRPLAEMSDF